MDSLQSHAYTEQLDEIEAECIRARAMIDRGCLFPLNDPLRESLGYMGEALQEALNDGAVLTMEGVVRLCADEALKASKTLEIKPEDTADFSRRLFCFSCRCIWLSDKHLCH